MSTNLRPLASAILKSGIIHEDHLSEFKKWGVQFDHDPDTSFTFTSVDDVVHSIETALQSEGLVVERITDVDVAKQYLSTAAPGKLHVDIDGVTADFSVVYGRTLLGEYIIPWKGDDVSNEMTNGKTCLYLEVGDSLVYFSSAKSCFYGETKAFMVCTAAALVTPQSDVSDQERQKKINLLLGLPKDAPNS